MTPELFRRNCTNAYELMYIECIPWSYTFPAPLFSCFPLFCPFFFFSGNRWIMTDYDIRITFGNGGLFRTTWN